MLDAHAWPLQGGHLRVAKSNQRAQLHRQAGLNVQLGRHYSQPHRSSFVLAAIAKPVTNTEAVRAEFVKAGIPEEVIIKVLR